MYLAITALAHQFGCVLVTCLPIAGQARVCLGPGKQTRDPNIVKLLEWPETGAMKVWNAISGGDQPKTCHDPLAGKSDEQAGQSSLMVE